MISKSAASPDLVIAVLNATSCCMQLSYSVALSFEKLVLWIIS